MSSGIHCDGPACDTWAFYDMAQNSGFLSVFDGVFATLATRVLHFCCWDCLLRYAGEQSPLDKYNFNG